MKAVHINPFLNSSLDLFESMLSDRPRVGQKCLLKRTGSHRWDISGVIEVTGPAKGIVAIRLTNALMERLMRASGVECYSTEELVETSKSMVGEFANIIAGNALGKISQYDLDIKVPYIVQGKNHTIEFPNRAPIISIPFVSSQGPFEVNVSLEEDPLYGLF